MSSGYSSLKQLGVASVLVAALGCSSTPEIPPKTEPVYTIAHRQLPPEPVYNRLSWAVLPQPVPGELKVKGPRMSKKLGVNFRGTRLETASNQLGKLFGYHSYCAASIADRRISLKEHGDLDELAEALAQQASIRAVVDHENRELRLFALDSANAP